MDSNITMNNTYCTPGIVTAGTLITLTVVAALTMNIYLVVYISKSTTTISKNFFPS